MKIYHKITACLLLALSSCEALVDDMNTDPNNPTEAPAEMVFTGTQLANMAVQEGMASRLGNIWSGYLTGADRQWMDYFSYNVTASSFDGDWNNVYRGTLANSLITIEKAEETGNQLMMGITKIIQVNSIATATELWGDVPYEDAGRIEEVPNASFEAQADLYPKLIATLDEAIANIGSGIGSVGAEDVHFNGNATAWMETAYTLKARLYMDIKDYASASEAAQSGISTYANSLYGPHGTVSDVNENLNWAFLSTERTGDIYAEGAYGVTILDPASPDYRGNAKTNETARYHFYYLENGINTPGEIEPNTTTSATEHGFFARDASFPMVTYQENILTLAETALRTTSDFAGALGYLNTYREFMNGGGYIDPVYVADTSVMYLPYVAADFAPGGMENMDGLSANDALLREILEERYVSFYGQHLGWNEERRNRNTNVGIQITPNQGSNLPWRFIYSQNEINSNPNSPSPVPGPFDVMSIYE